MKMTSMPVANHAAAHHATTHRHAAATHHAALHAVPLLHHRLPVPLLHPCPISTHLADPLV